MKVAVVGAGITGLSAAWLLAQRHSVTLLEADSRIGGHAHTVNVEAPEGVCPIDTGFIVYNTACYPNLIALFNHLDVPTAETSMGFAVSLGGGAYEYSGSGIGGLFGQLSNLAMPSHWRMTAEIFRFFREASAVDLKSIPATLTLAAWLRERGYSHHFINAHIVPMGSAIWSAPADEMLAFPFAAFVRFFGNHGLLQAFNRPAWRTVRGGSREYVSRLAAAFTAAPFPGEIRRGAAVQHVMPAERGVRIRTAASDDEHFDGVVLACHADQALAMIDPVAADFHAVLKNFRYAPNEAVLHTDASQMPRRKHLWSAWNYIGQAGEVLAGEVAAGEVVAGKALGGTHNQPPEQLSVSYWMNKLQPLATGTDYFVTLNPVRPVAAGAEIQRFQYRHPMFDAAALAAQLKLPALQGRNNIWLAGSYFGYGFHEDGAEAGLAAAEDISLRLGGVGGRVERPWPWDPARGRIAALPSQPAQDQRETA